MKLIRLLFITLARCHKLHNMDLLLLIENTQYITKPYKNRIINCVPRSKYVSSQYSPMEAPRYCNSIFEADIHLYSTFTAYRDPHLWILTKRRDQSSYNINQTESFSQNLYHITSTNVKVGYVSCFIPIYCVICPLLLLWYSDSLLLVIDEM